MSKKTRKPKQNHTLSYLVKEQIKLLPFLLQIMPERSRNSVKSILARGQVMIDGREETQFDFLLHPGQTVSILKNKEAQKRNALIGMKILHEDEDLIVIYKEEGLLSIATEKEKQMTAYHQLMEHVRYDNPRNRVFVVHRLDKETSGVMMFAKKEAVKRKLQEAWKANVTERSYVALVEGEVTKTEGSISSWLKESKTHRMYSSSIPNDGLHAITHYKKMQGNRAYSLLKIALETGRKNQIRVHMQDIGHPIVGDKKYGSKTNKIRRLGLHALVLEFFHPTTGKKLRFETKIPSSFLTLSK